MPACLSVYLPTLLPACLAIFRSVCLLFSLHACLSVCLIPYMPACLYVCLSLCLSVYISTCWSWSSVPISFNCVSCTQSRQEPAPSHVQPFILLQYTHVFWLPHRHVFLKLNTYNVGERNYHNKFLSHITPRKIKFYLTNISVMDGETDIVNKI